MARISVLICDDVPALRELLGTALALSPEIEVVGEAENGEAAIVEAERLRPDVMLLDLAMPVMDGLEALPKIRTISPNTRVVVLSAFESRSMAPQALRLGAAAYVEKGADPAELAQLIEEVARVVA